MEIDMKQYLRIASLSASVAACLVIQANAQDLTGGASVFVFSRPAGAAGQAAKSAYRVKNRLPPRKSLTAKTKTANPSGSVKQPTLPSEASEIAQIGVTLWRLRPEKGGEQGARLLKMSGTSSDPLRMVAERVGLDTAFKKGDKVRLSIESPRAGYLYIVDRELLGDNKLGVPYLIFPTRKTHGGDNSVSAGKIIEIPAQTDNPFYFEIDPMAGDYAGELLTVLVSPTKIPNLTLGDEPIKLPPAMVEQWETQWEGSATTLELDGGRSLVYTEEEKEAGTGSRQLTQKSPAPQTVISVEATKGKAFLVSFPLKVTRGGS
jgi:hypothetical protein